MTDDLYERYKEALRVGHVAVLRGELDEALRAYRTAASIAPSRALPHTSLGGVLLRLGHLEEALVEYAAAVARAPHDEGALLGQAEALSVAGQRSDAAQTLDHVAEIQEASGRLPEAADTLRRALELDDAPERARHQRGLLREIRLSAGDQAAEQMLARALRLRDVPASGASEPARAVSPAVSAAAFTNMRPEEGSRFARVHAEAAVAPAEPVLPASSLRARILNGATWDAGHGRLPEDEEPGDADQIEPSDSAPVAASIEPAAETVKAENSVSVPAPAAAAERVDSGPAEEPAEEPAEPADTFVAGAGAGHEKAGAIEPVLASIGVMDGAFDTAALMGSVAESQHQPTGDELLAAAEAADAAGDNTALRSLLLWTARAYAREGRFEAGLDATHRLLQREPGDVDAHLVLVELYVARDWNSLAAEKLVLLGRLADLNNDTETKRRLCAVATRAFPGDERLAALYS